LIVATAALVGRLIAMRYGSAVGVVAALLYAALPNVIAGYTWISNSQHLLAHFFCALFFVVYFAARHERFRWHTVAALEGVLLLALLSNHSRARSQSFRLSTWRSAAHRADSEAGGSFSASQWSRPSRST
jgi:hypothetical protein